jgi:hypothetical protein
VVEEVEEGLGSMLTNLIELWWTREGKGGARSNGDHGGRIGEE